MARIIEITDFSDPQLDVYARLTEAQLLNRHCLTDGLFIAESPLVIGRALDAGYEPVSLLMERKHIEGQAREIIARCGDVPVYTAEFDVLTQLTGFMLTRRRDLSKRPAHRTAGKRDESHQCGRHFPQRRSAEYGRRSPDAGMQQSPLPPQCPGQHGHRVPDPLDLSGQ